MLGHMVYFTLKDRSPANVERMVEAEAKGRSANELRRLRIVPVGTRLRQDATDQRGQRVLGAADERGRAGQQREVIARRRQRRELLCAEGIADLRRRRCG